MAFPSFFLFPEGFEPISGGTAVMKISQWAVIIGLCSAIVGRSAGGRPRETINVTIA
ncbi:hypothetical protein [Novosphingobium clariflavum]|uniref:Uncharacterized protein n=1 Tax=Novosphingobium clariflavum TaxID=2029884 RepID=A0ABV6S2D1_9SPHN|nr:hypothetical protein [Novosphingobium clariflavum]